MYDVNIHTRGILNPQLAKRKFQLIRYPPAEDLSFLIDRYWIIHWDLRGQDPYVQQTLPYPCVNLVFERGETGVWGVDSGKFARQLVGMGQVFGVKFRPGGFYPFVKVPIANFTDGVLSFDSVFEVAPDKLEEELFSLNDSEKIHYVEDFLRQFLPEQDNNIALVNELIDYITSEQWITKVDDLAGCFQLSKRGLQRLFQQYVGVSPKWVLQRYRLHEAAEHVATSTIDDWSQLALSLGYYDQAHFIKDFKLVIGKTPLEYRKSLNADAEL